MNDFSKFIQLVETTRDESLLEDFLIGVTTPSERKKIVQRIQIIERLLKGETQHQIAGDLGVGVATVTRGSRELAQGRFQILRKKS